MFSPIARCSYCSDEYDPVEYVTVPLDPDEPRFCSDSCDQRYWESLSAQEAYEQSGFGAPLW